MGGSKKQIKVIVHNDSVVFHVIWLILQPNGYLFPIEEEVFQSSIHRKVIFFKSF